MSFVFNPMDPEVLRNPYPTYKRMRDEHPVYRHPGGFWVLTRYQDVAEGLKDATTFSSAAMGRQNQQQMPMGMAQHAAAAREGDGGRQLDGIGQSLISEDPPTHTEQRNIVNRGFSPSRIGALEPRILELAEELFASFEPRGHCDLTEEFANPLPVSVIAELLGLDPNRRDDFKKWSSDIIIGATQVGGMGAGVIESMLKFRDTIEEAVEDRKQNPGTDLISILVDAGLGEGILDADSTMGFAGLLLAAGSETTTNLIGNVMVTLLENPALLKEIRENNELIKPLLEESLRCDPPVQMLMRLTTQDTKVAETEIPAGNMVMMMLGSANRDETRFPNPDDFDIERNTQGHLGFGFGNHFCLGSSLARLEASIAMRHILERLSKPRLCEPEVEYHGSFLIRGPATLPIEFDVHAAA
jgi:cytochrome P450